MAFIDLSICSYNCCSLKKNINSVRELTNSNYDLIFLQETFIIQDKLNIMDYISEHYECISEAATYSDKALTSMAGRPEGGMAILYRKSSRFVINKIELHKSYLILSFNFLGFTIVLVNVYMNSDNWEISTLNKYLSTLAELEDVLYDYKFDAIHFVEDDPLSGRAWRNLSNFMINNLLECIDVSQLPSDSFTFVNYGNSFSRWLDHVVGRQTDDIYVKNVGIRHEIFGSDHSPIHFDLSVRVNNLNVSMPVTNSVPIEEAPSYYVKWDKLLEADYNVINELIDEHLKPFNNHPLFQCSSTGCHNKQHLSWISDLYQHICTNVDVVLDAFKSRHVNTNKFKVIPGWNRRVKDSHNIARNCYLNWINAGKLRGTKEHDDMLQSRRVFKDNLKQCKSNKQNEISQSIMDKFRLRDKTEFWKTIKRKRGKAKVSNIVDGKSCNGDIADLFKQKFLNPNDVNNSDDDANFLELLKREWDTKDKMHVRMSVVSLKRALSKLNHGVGHDGLHSLFLSKLSEYFLTFLANLLNFCFVRCYIPVDMLKGNILPIVKDKKGNIANSSNYRPIMQSSCLIKIIEYHLLDICSEKASIDCRQLGFKKGVSTSDACFLLKEVMHNYSQNKGRAFLMFVDLSKAFDNVNHFILGKKLLEKNIPIDIVFLLMHYLRNQYANVVWRGHHTRYCPVEMGVRQGGILSPFLFKLYVDAIVSEIVSMNIGCKLESTRFNIITYADDIVLAASNESDLEKLFIKLNTEMTKLNLHMYVTKTKCMLVGKSTLGVNKTVCLGGTDFKMVQSYKYLGHLVRSDLQDSDDVDNHLKTFYAQSNSVLREFKTVNTDALVYLFSSYCNPDYGICLWNHKSTLQSCNFKTFFVAYSNALKRLLGVPPRSSSHEAAERCALLLFSHHLALVQARFYKRLQHSNCSIIKFNIPILENGYALTFIHALFKDKYNVSLSNNTLDINKSHISWVQHHEERHVPVFRAS